MAHSLLRTETVRYDEAEIVLETSTLYSTMLRNELVERLEKHITREKNYVYKYCEVVTQARKAKGLGFEFPDPEADDDAHLKVFHAYMRLPTPLIGDLMGALDRLNTAPQTKPALQPGVTSDDPKSAAPEPSSDAA